MGNVDFKFPKKDVFQFNMSKKTGPTTVGKISTAKKRHRLDDGDRLKSPVLKDPMLQVKGKGKQDNGKGIFSWNVRGALGEAGQLFIKDIVGYKKSDIVIIVETRCQFSRARYFWQRMGYDPIGVEEARGFNGGIWVLKQTNSMFNVRLRSLHQQVVTIELWRENLSWVCSAIYASPAPALRDCLWDHLGDGSSSLWFEDWSGLGFLADNVPFVNFRDINLSLAELVTHNNWCTIEVYTVIPQNFRDKLSFIPPSLSLNNSDRWMWWNSDKGLYTVKEAYKWLNNIDTDVRDNQEWSWIWKLKVPQKVRLFVWRVLQDAIPTNVKRFSCNLAVSPACSRCSIPSENGLHCLRDCAHSKEIWLRFGALSWTHFNDPNLYSWIHILATGPNSMKFLAALWGNWKWRNNMALDDEKWTLEVAWRRICHDHHDWCSSYDWGGNHSNHFLSKVWAPPLEGWVKVNTDGSYHDDRKMMGYGGLVRDHASGWIKGFLGCYNGGSAFISEARALMEGINLAWSLGFRKVICEVDSADLLVALENTETRNFVHEIDEIRLGMDKDWQIVLFMKWTC
ncbi:unnamed protein product [Lupinus luteus]|uniref:RNase H type-1 domain-containing protein n=1 Tax=Lupinus luteus TaxID=3873 RepID=A0AAV1WYT1_LUPLU